MCFLLEMISQADQKFAKHQKDSLFLQVLNETNSKLLNVSVFNSYILFKGCHFKMYRISKCYLSLYFWFEVKIGFVRSHDFDWSTVLKIAQMYKSNLLLRLKIAGL